MILLASVSDDPRRVLFADEAGERPLSDLKTDAFGFYGTEGRGGLGWAQDAVPTLKGGSTIGIPSPPAIWVPDAPDGQLFVTPSVEDAELMQGFDHGWTDVAGQGRKNGPRWKLVGNAVTTRVAAWVADRMVRPGDVVVDLEGAEVVDRWPTAAWGRDGTARAVRISEFPVLHPYEHLSGVVDLSSAARLSGRAIRGFQGRLAQGNLGRHEGFREAVARYADAVGGSTTRAPIATPRWGAGASRSTCCGPRLSCAHMPSKARSS